MTQDQKKARIIERWVCVLVSQGVQASVARAAIEGALNDSVPVKRARAAPVMSDSIASQSKPLMQQYQSLYRDRYGECPVVSGQEYVNISKLLKQYGSQVVSARLNAFYQWDDPWVDKVGRTLGVFYKQWNSLATWVAKRSQSSESVVGCRHVPACRSAVDHSRKVIQERESLHTTSMPSAVSSAPASSTTPTSTKSPRS